MPAFLRPFLRPKQAPPLPSATSDSVTTKTTGLTTGTKLRECPICFVSKDDVEPLPHLNPAAGEGWLSHAMCGECRASWNSFACPFCRGKIGGAFVPSKEIQSF